MKVDDQEMVQALKKSVPQSSCNQRKNATAAKALVTDRGFHSSWFPKTAWFHCKQRQLDAYGTSFNKICCKAGTWSVEWDLLVETSTIDEGRHQEIVQTTEQSVPQSSWNQKMKATIWHRCWYFRNQKHCLQELNRMILLVSGFLKKKNQHAIAEIF